MGFWPFIKVSIQGLGKSFNLAINAIFVAKSGNSNNQPDCEAEAEYDWELKYTPKTQFWEKMLVFRAEMGTMLNCMCKRF